MCDNVEAEVVLTASSGMDGSQRANHCSNQLQDFAKTTQTERFTAHRQRRRDYGNEADEGSDRD